MTRKSLFFIAILFLTFCWNGYAETEKNQTKITNVLTINKLEIDGLSRTKKSVIIDELKWIPGKTYTFSELEDRVQEIRNTNLFNKVEFEIKNEVLQLKLEERWTTIPIFKFSSGGGLTQITAGIYDSNVNGDFLEAGLQWEKLGDANSIIAWFANPRLFQEHLRLDLQLWNTNRIRYEYDQNAIDTNENIRKNGYLHQRARFLLGLTYRINKNLSYGVDIENHNDSFSLDYIDDKVKTIVDTNQSLPESSQYLIANSHVTFGRLHIKKYQSIGQELKLQASYARSHQHPGKDDFSKYTLAYIGKISLWGNSLLAIRAETGITNTMLPQYYFFFGGHDRIRGFADNRFKGRAFWLLNSELRIHVMHYQGVVIQAVPFFDSLAAREKAGDLTGASGTSIGAGLRFIIPKIYRFVARLDVAKPIVKKDEMPISFGVAHFF